MPPHRRIIRGDISLPPSAGRCNVMFSLSRSSVQTNNEDANVDDGGNDNDDMNAAKKQLGHASAT